MENKKKLEVQGWNISDDGLALISENSNDSYQVLLNNALNSDIKEFGTPVLSSEIKKSNIQKMVLQIQKVRNTAAPKAKENSQAAPRMLKLTLTDGHSYCQAVEMENVPKLSRSETAPGSKILINNALVVSSCILLTPSTCLLLGGKVPALHEKWELVKDISDQIRSNSSSDGAPPWVDFGQKIISSAENQFKALGSKASKEATDEFDVQRKDAIAVAASGGVKKVFGGGTKTSQTNLEKEFEKKGRNLDSQENRGFRSKKEAKDKATDVVQKPPDKVSLFAFLEDKLPTPLLQTELKSNTLPSDGYKQYNNRGFRGSEGNAKKHYDDFGGPKLKQYDSNSTNFGGPRKYYSENNDGGSKKKAYGDTNDSFKKPYEPRPYPQYSSDFGGPKRTPNTYKTSDFSRPRSHYNDNHFTDFNRSKYNSSGDFGGAKRTANPLQHNSNFAVYGGRDDFNRPKSDTTREFGGPKMLHNDDDFGGPKLHNSVNNFKTNETIVKDMNDMSISNNQFASRTLRQALNLGQNPRSGDAKPNEGRNWRKGDKCMAKYWEDNKYYNATIEDLTKTTCVVRFVDYGNVEEVLKGDCSPVTDAGHHRGSMEFRRTSNNRRPFNNQHSNKSSA